MERIIFVSGGPWQKPFVQYLKDKGHFIAIVNPIANNTTSLADYHIKTDVNNLDDINKHIEQLKPSFITSDQSDISTLAVARLNERWKLPGNSVDIIDKFTNKFSIYEFGKSINVPVPETRLVSCLKDMHEFADTYGFPIIIKPTDGTMSRGFRKMESAEDITEDTLTSSLKFSKSKQCIVQKFVPGYMITLEGVCSGNKHRTTATSKKDGYFKPGITSGVRYPSKLPTDLLNDIIKVNDYYVEMAGMKFGLTHSEYIINGNDFTLIEIGARGGGAGITDKIVPWVSGVNVYDVLYESLMNRVVDVKNLPTLQRPALLKYYHANDVVNCNEDKAERIQKVPGVAEFQFNFIGKQYVSDANDSRHTMGIYLSETEEGIEGIVQAVSAIINE